MIIVEELVRNQRGLPTSFVDWVLLFNRGCNAVQYCLPVIADGYRVGVKQRIWQLNANRIFLPADNDAFNTDSFKCISR